MILPTVKDIVDIIDEIAPFELAESWDNSGLQTGHPDWPVAGILISLDVTPEVIAAAGAAGCAMVVSHHPLMMSPEKSLDFSRMPGRVIYAAAKNNIAVVSAHTNLDKAWEGLNDYMAEQIGLQCEMPLLTDVDFKAPFPAGIGRTGRLSTPMTVRDLAAHIKTQLNTPFVRVVGNPDLEAATASLCTGSGGSLINHFLKTQTDVYITGDLKYHEARDIESAGRACIDVGHFASEHIVVDMLTHRLNKEMSLREFEVNIIGYKKEEDPFRII